MAKLTEASLDELDTPASRAPPVPPGAEVAVVPPRAEPPPALELEDVLLLPADAVELWLALEEVDPPCPASALELELAPP